MNDDYATTLQALLEQTFGKFVSKREPDYATDSKGVTSTVPTNIYPTYPPVYPTVAPYTTTVTIPSVETPKDELARVNAELDRALAVVSTQRELIATLVDTVDALTSVITDC